MSQFRYFSYIRPIRGNQITLTNWVITPVEFAKLHCKNFKKTR